MKNALLLLILPFAGFSQSGSLMSSSMQKSGFNYPFFMNETKEITYVNEGSPYESEEFNNGNLNFNGKEILVAPMRFNSIKQVIEFKDENSTVREVLRRPEFSATFNGKTYKIFEFELPNNQTQLGYFNPLFIGNHISFLLKPGKYQTISAPSSHTAYGSSTKVAIANYIENSSYYIKHDKALAQLIELNKSNILRALSDKFIEVSNFMNTNNLNLKKEADVIRLLSYYDSLKSIKPVAKQGKG